MVTVLLTACDPATGPTVALYLLCSSKSGDAFNVNAVAGEREISAPRRQANGRRGALWVAGGVPGDLPAARGVLREVVDGVRPVQHRRLVHILDDDVDVQFRLGVVGIGRLDDHLVVVVPTGVRRALVVGRAGELQLPLEFMLKSPLSVPDKLQEKLVGPSGSRGNVLINRDDPVLVIVVGRIAQVNLRGLVHVCYRHRHGKCGGVGLVVPRLHRDVIDVVPARVPGNLEVGRAGLFE